jgi:N utilization substance protein B
VERALLKLGCAEILYFADIPPRVTINEYIELAKVFSNENAPPFINGILDKLVHKTGKPDMQKKS